jgi:hypothetical protein
MRFPRGSLPPSAFEAITQPQPQPQPQSQPQPHEAREVTPPATTGAASAPGTSPRRECDLASTCPNCGTLMQPEHAHYRCATCGYRDSCCF